MAYSVIKHFMYGLGLLVLLVGIMLPAGACRAQDSRHDGWILPDHYPDRFSGHGCIDRLEGDEIVIDDRLYRLASDATYHTFQNQYASRSHFRKGLRVGFINDANKRIGSLWYIDKCR